jgi:hypothetical protein
MLYNQGEHWSPLAVGFGVINKSYQIYQCSSQFWRILAKLQIYIIPIRLDNTTVPESLADKHWLDWHAPNAKDQLLKAIGKYL